MNSCPNTPAETLGLAPQLTPCNVIPLAPWPQPHSSHLSSSHLGDAGSSEGHDHGHHVDGELELQELGDAVVDVPSPHDCLHDAGEVVIC